MLAEKIPIAMWMLVSVLLGSGVDYFRTQTVDKQVMCFFALMGLLSGSAFRWIGLRWGDIAAVAAGFGVMAAIYLLSFQYIKDYIIDLQRQKVSSEDEKWYQEFKEEVANEKKKTKDENGDWLSVSELLKRRKSCQENSHIQKKKKN